MITNRRQIHHKRNRLQQLRVFCRAAELKNMGEAATALGISQPAVSLQVRELEYELEALLFERSGPHVALTEAGERLYRMAAPLVETLDRLPDTLAEQLREDDSGEVRLAAGSTMHAFVLPPVVKRFRDAYPAIRIRTQRIQAREGLELLAAGDTDLMVFTEMSVEPDLPVRYRPLFECSLVLITPLDHPLAGRRSVDIHEAGRYPAIVPAAGTLNREFGEAIARRFGVRLNVAIETTGWGVIKEYVAAGLGISVVPSRCLTGQEERLWTVPFGHYTPPLGYGLYTRADAPLRAPAERLAEVLSRELSALRAPAPDPVGEP